MGRRVEGHTAMAGPGTLWSFEGRWRIERQISDPDGTPTATFAGEAQFRRAGAVLTQDESGWLEIAASGARLWATRRYRWRSEGQWIAIAFEDGKPFHAFPVGVSEPEATHLCSPDRYEVAYDFRDWPGWSAVWRVTGPRKDYVMTSRYSRAA